MSPKKSLRIDEVADEFRVSRRTVQRWIKSGELDTVKIGGTRRIWVDEIQKKSDDECQPETSSAIKRV